MGGSERAGVVPSLPRGEASTCDRKLGRKGGRRVELCAWGDEVECMGGVLGGEGVAALLRFNVGGIAEVTGRWRVDHTRFALHGLYTGHSACR